MSRPDFRELRNRRRREGSRSNLLLQSEDFTTSWIIVRATATANTAVAPDGTTTADSINDDATGAQTHGIRQLYSFTGDTLTLSASFKASNKTWVAITLPDSAGVSRGVFFDLSNEVVGTIHANFIGAGMEASGNGWYRCWVTSTAPSGSDFTFYGGDSDGDNTFDGQSQEMFLVWGAQLSPDPYLIDYRKTTTAAILG